MPHRGVPHGRAFRAGRFLRRRGTEALEAIGRPVVRAAGAASRFRAGFLGPRPVGAGLPPPPDEAPAQVGLPAPPGLQRTPPTAQQSLDFATLQRATGEALPFAGEARQVAGGELPTFRETPPLTGVQQVGSRRFLPGTSAAAVTGALGARQRPVQPVQSGQVGPSAPSFLDRTRRNAALFGIRRADFTPQEQLVSERNLQIREARTLEDKQRLREQFRQEDIQQRTGVEGRAVQRDVAQAAAQAAGQKGIPVAQINAAARQGISAGGNATQILYRVIKNGVPVVDPKTGQPRLDVEGNPVTRPPTQDEIAQAKQQIDTQFGIQTGQTNPQGAALRDFDRDNSGQLEGVERNVATQFMNTVLDQFNRADDATKERMQRDPRFMKAKAIQSLLQKQATQEARTALG